MSVLAFPTVVSDPIFQPSSKVLIFDGSFDGCFDVVKCSLCHNLRGMAAPRNGRTAAPRNGRMAVLPPRGMAVRLPRGMAVWPYGCPAEWPRGFEITWFENIYFPTTTVWCILQTRLHY